MISIGSHLKYRQELHRLPNNVRLVKGWRSQYRADMGESIVAVLKRRGISHSKAPMADSRYKICAEMKAWLRKPCLR